MVMVYYIVTRHISETPYWGAPYMDVAFYPSDDALQAAMFAIMEETAFEVDRTVSAYAQWDEAEEFFPREYHWGMQRFDALAGNG